MKTTRSLTSLTLLALFGVFVEHGLADENVSADELNHRAIERRAVEAVIWGMPVVNTD